MVWNLVVLLVFGAIAGWLASVFLGRNKRMGCLSNTVIGILGSLLAGWIMRMLFPAAPEISPGINLYSILLGAAGAVLLLLVTGWYKGRSR